MTLFSGEEVVARLARGDVNMPGFDGFSLESQIAEIEFEAAVYELLRDHSQLKTSRLLYHRAPAQCRGEKSAIPKNIVGRRLMVFNRAAGRSSGAWNSLSGQQQVSLKSEAHQNEHTDCATVGSCHASSDPPCCSLQLRAATGLREPVLTRPTLRAKTQRTPSTSDPNPRLLRNPLHLQD